jgi:hypothetical protein
MWVIGHIIDSAQQREESNSRDLLLVALSNARPVPYVVDVYVCVYTKQDNRASVSQHIEVIRDRLFPPPAQDQSAGRVRFRVPPLPDS